MAEIKLGNLLYRNHTRPISQNDPVDTKDVNSDDIKDKLVALNQELTLLKTELETIKANQLSGDQKVQLSGTMSEVSSQQYTESSGAVRTYTKAQGASRIELYVESGRVRIRTDGQPCTLATGEPLGEGFGAMWVVDSISVYFVDDAVITVVSR